MSGFLGDVSGIVGSVSGIAGSLSAITGGFAPPNYYSFAPWAVMRLPASFRGVPFVILENNMRRGRQVAMHTYPFRDTTWPEDLGRSPRITSFRGFVVGDDADNHMQALMAAVEAPGSGQLVHPVLGSFSVQVLAFSCSDTAEEGRRWSFEMTVTTAYDRIYPIATAATQSILQGLFGGVGTALAQDFATVANTVHQVQTSVTGVVQTVQGYVSQVNGLVHDAQNLARLPSTLAGNFGRYNGANIAANTPGTASVTSFALASSTVNGGFQDVSRIGSSLAGLAGAL
jgi:prophage DNA circulation protein